MPVDKKARPTTTEEDGPLDPNRYGGGGGSCSTVAPSCNEAIVVDQQCWPNHRTESGNYHAKIGLRQRKFAGGNDDDDDEEDEVCRDFDAAIALVEGYGNAAAVHRASSGCGSEGRANLVSSGKIDCISKGAASSSSDSDLFVQHQGCCDGGLVSGAPAQHHHDGNNNVNCSTSSPSFLGQQHRTEEAIIMGANVSRHHEKGLTGRRAQSTGKFRFLQNFQVLIEFAPDAQWDPTGQKSRTHVYFLKYWVKLINNNSCNVFIFSSTLPLFVKGSKKSSRRNS